MKVVSICALTFYCVNAIQMHSYNDEEENDNAEDPWASMDAFVNLTEDVVQKSEPPKPDKSKEIAAAAEKKKKDDEEAEQQAIKEARDELLTLDPIPDSSLIQLTNNVHDDVLTSKLMENISANVDSAQRTVQDDEEKERMEKAKEQDTEQNKEKEQQEALAKELEEDNQISLQDEQKKEQDKQWQDEQDKAQKEAEEKKKAAEEQKRKEEEEHKKVMNALPKTLSTNADSVIDEIMNEQDTKPEAKKKDEINYEELIKANPASSVVEPPKFASISKAAASKDEKVKKQINDKSRMTLIQKLKLKAQAKQKMTESASSRVQSSVVSSPAPAPIKFQSLAVTPPPAPQAPSKPSMSSIMKMKLKAKAKLAIKNSEATAVPAPIPAAPTESLSEAPKAAPVGQGFIKSHLNHLIPPHVTKQAIAAQESAIYSASPDSPLFRELSPAEKAAKEKLENPTIDENGEHIQTVEEAKLEARAMQNMLDEGVANVDRNIELRNQMAAQMPAEPVQQEEDDGHIETVEEVKARMKKLSENMNADLEGVNTRAQQSEADMPDMSALTTMTGSIHRMGLSQSQRQVNLLAAKLGVAVQDGDDQLAPESMSNTLVARAQAMGKSQQEIQEALSDV